MSASTKNMKDNRKIVRVQLYAPELIFKIPDGLDLEDKTVVEEWYYRNGFLHIKYVGKEEGDIIDPAEEIETDYKYEETKKS